MAAERGGQRSARRRVADPVAGPWPFSAARRPGRIDYHPVFPDRPGPASRRIEDEDDVRDVIELLRLNYVPIRRKKSRPDVVDAR
ncbi:MAG: luciferase family protein [Actinomycetota bacterium]